VKASLATVSGGGTGIKHKWEQPFTVVPISSLSNCFGRGVRLRLWWLAAFSSISYLRNQVDYFQPIAFRFSLLQHHLPAVPSVSLAVHLPGRSVWQNMVNSSLAIRNLPYGTFAASQLSCPPEWKETCVSFFPGLQLNLSNERRASFRVDRTWKISLFRPTSDSSIAQTRGLEWSGSMLN